MLHGIEKFLRASGQCLGQRLVNTLRARRCKVASISLEHVTQYDRFARQTSQAGSKVLSKRSFRGPARQRQRLISCEYFALFTQDRGGAITMAQTVNILALKAGPKRRCQGRRPGQFAGSPLANPHLARFALEIGVEGKHTPQSRLRNMHFLRDSTDLAGVMSRLSRDRFVELYETLPFAAVGFAVTSFGSHGIGRELSGSVRNLTRVTLPEDGGRKLAHCAIRARSLP